MKLSNLAALFIVTLLSFLLSSCLLKEPYSKSKNIRIDERLLGKWESKVSSKDLSYRVKIVKIDRYTYGIDFYQEADVIGSPMICRVKAEGYLSKSNSYLLGQFKITEFMQIEDRKEKRIPDWENGYIIGVFEDIGEASFKFNWFSDELLAEYARNSTDMPQEYLIYEKWKDIIDLFLKTGDFRENQYQFIRKQDIEVSGEKIDLSHFKLGDEWIRYTYFSEEEADNSARPVGWCKIIFKILSAKKDAENDEIIVEVTEYFSDALNPEKYIIFKHLNNPYHLVLNGEGRFMGVEASRQGNWSRFYKFPKRPGYIKQMFREDIFIDSLGRQTE